MITAAVPGPRSGLRIRRLAVLLACAVGPAVGCSRESRPSVLLITIDTLRADRLGCYGYEGAETPNLDGLASEGVLFEQAGAQVPVTLPSHATILTGLLPASHGVHDNSTFSLSDTVTTIAEVLRGAGYRTGAVVGAYVLAGQFGLGQGFEHYDDSFAVAGSDRRAGLLERPAADVAQRGIAWLDERPDDRFFLWLHFFDPHRPYDPPPPYAGRFAGREYDGEVAYVDSCVGEVLTYLSERRLDRSTLVVVVSDHGEGLGQHDEQTHGYFVYETTMRVPLLMRWPDKLPAGMRAAALATTTDIVPTLLSLVGGHVPEHLEGIDLVQALRGAAPTDRVALGEALPPLYDFGFSPLVSVRTAQWKYVAGPVPGLYDLSADPTELRNVADVEPDVARTFADVACTYAARLAGGTDARRAMPEDERRKLLALGYLSSPHQPLPDIARWRELEDPRDHTGLIAAAMDAMALVAQGRHADAVLVLEQLPAETPATPLLHHLLGWAYREAHRLDDAAQVLREGVALDSSYARLWTLLGEVELLRGRFADAVGALDHAVELVPFDAWPHYLMGRALLRLDRFTDSRHHLQAAVKLQPSLWEARLQLARLFLDAGATDSALAYAELAMVYEAGTANARELMGHCYEARGTWPEAGRVYADAAAADSSRTDLYQKAALCYHRAGMEDEAARALLDYTARHGEESGVLSILAGWYVARGDTADAVTMWRKALSLDSSTSAAWAGIIAVTAVREGPRAASLLARRAVATCPEDSALASIARRIISQPR